jgi:hypothetical protein
MNAQAVCEKSLEYAVDPLAEAIAEWQASSDALRVALDEAFYATDLLSLLIK